MVLKPMGSSAILFIIIDLLLLKEEMDQPIIEEDGGVRPAANG